MRPIGKLRPNSGTTARVSDLAGGAVDARLNALREKGSGRAAVHRNSKIGTSVTLRLPVERQGAGRLARAKD